MAVHVFGTYSTATYLVEADSEAEAKGAMWDHDTPDHESVEYLGTVEEVLDGVDVVKVTP